MLKMPQYLLRLKLGILLGAAALLLAGVLLHAPGLNGPWYWKWAWRRLPAAPVYFWIILASLPIIAAQFIRQTRKSLSVLAVAMLVAGSFAVRIAAAWSRDDLDRLGYISKVARDPSMTSYYTDALSLTDLSLREAVLVYPDRMPRFHLHTQSKPPGPLVYWWLWIAALGDSAQTARLGGILLGAIAAMSVASGYLMLRSLLNDPPAAFAGASFLALCPGFVLFFPMFDPTYPLLGTTMILLWWLALRRDRFIFAVMLGAVLAAMTFVSFSLLVLGPFMVAMVFLASDRGLRARLISGARLAGITLCSLLLCLALLWLILGYDPLATFASAWRNQHALLAIHADERPYPATILFDLTDFALGSGWISIILLIFYFIPPDTLHRRRLVIVVIGQLLLVAVVALLQSETARVWNFLLPLLMIPVGLELSRWTLPARLAVLASLAVLTAAIYQNMSFLF